MNYRRSSSGQRAMHPDARVLTAACMDRPGLCTIHVERPLRCRSGIELADPHFHVRIVRTAERKTREHSIHLDRGRPACRGHGTGAGRRRCREGGQRPSWNCRLPGPAGLPAVPQGHEDRSQGPILGGAGSIRPVSRPLLAHSVQPVVPDRLRTGTRRSQGTAHLGVQDPRPSRVRAHRFRRDHHRAAGIGHLQCRRHGHGSSP